MTSRHRTRGSPRDRAKDYSPELWASLHQKWLAVAAGVGLAGTLAGTMAAVWARSAAGRRE